MSNPPSPISIGNLEVGYTVRPKIIAEIGINHMGSLDLAKKMAYLAVNSGADIVKTQLHIPSAEMSSAAKELVPSHCDESIFEIMDSCSLSLDDEYKLKIFIESLGAEYLSTPFSAEAAHVLGRDFNVNAFKIGSGECNNEFVLSAACSYHIPLIISTGMNSLDSCRSTYEFIRKSTEAPLLFLHTTNLYPTPFELVRLGGITELQDILGINAVGLSDHTTNNLACYGAIALGSVLLERHFTDSMDREGPDISNSMDPAALSRLRVDSEQLFLMRGGSKVDELPQEQDTRDFAFATYVATVDIPMGALITESLIIPKRPANGDYFTRDRSSLVGKVALKNIMKDEHILNSHIL